MINSYYHNYNIISGTYYSNSQYFRNEYKDQNDTYSPSPRKKKKTKEPNELLSYEKFILEFYDDMIKEIDFKHFQHSYNNIKLEKTDLITWTNLSSVYMNDEKESIDISQIDKENDLFYFNRLITNNSDKERIIELFNSSFIMPPSSSFLMVLLFLIICL